MTAGARAPVSRQDMIHLIEDNIKLTGEALTIAPNNPTLARRLQVYYALSLKLRMEDPNAQD